MKTITVVLLWVVVAAHAGFVFIEMHPWDRPGVFDLVNLNFEPSTEETKAAPVVHNAGLYNCFLAAGLIGGIFSARNGFGIRFFCLVCAIVAGIFGALTLTPKTLLLQSLPAAVALGAVFWAWSVEGQARRSG
jgi:putative membrane protein